MSHEIIRLAGHEFELNIQHFSLPAWETFGDMGCGEFLNGRFNGKWE